MSGHQRPGSFDAKVARLLDAIPAPAPCRGRAANLISDMAGREYLEEVCGHPESSHGPHGCDEIIGDGCDVGDEHGARYCSCEGYVA